MIVVPHTNNTHSDVAMNEHWNLCKLHQTKNFERKVTDHTQNSSKYEAD